jgi:hypothetical protein
LPNTRPWNFVRTGRIMLRSFLVAIMLRSFLVAEPVAERMETR